MFRKFLAGLVALFLAAGLSACGGAATQPVPAGSSASPTSGEKPVVALIMKSLANEFFKTMEEGARAHQAANPDKYELIANGIKDELDVAAQIALVEQMVARKVSAIVLAPADSKALGPVCRKAMDAGVVVVNIDNRLDPDVLRDQGVQIPFVGPDNRKGARMAGDYIAGKLKKGDPVAIIEGIPAAYNGIQRKLGLDDAVKGAGLKLVASQSAYWEMDKANSLVAALLTEHPDLKAILCANDSMGLGAAAAVRAAGKTGRILVSGFDGIGAVRDLIRQYEFSCTVEQHADKQAVFGIEYALDMLVNKTTPADQETPIELVTQESEQ